MRRRTECSAAQGASTAAAIRFLADPEFWELAFFTPFWPLCVVGYICLIAALAYLLGVSVSDFLWWHHVLLAIALTEVWSGIVELCCRRALRRPKRNFEPETRRDPFLRHESRLGGGWSPRNSGRGACAGS